jgi:hypothetical protein
MASWRFLLFFVDPNRFYRIGRMNRHTFSTFNYGWGSLCMSGSPPSYRHSPRKAPQINIWNALSAYLLLVWVKCKTKVG